MTISHSKGTYEIRTTSISEALTNLPEDSYVVTDSRVANLYGNLVRAQVPLMAVPEGEHSKSLEHYGVLLNWLAKSGASRNSTVVALGGGVVGDLAGFAAASYMRGIRTIQVPTTLLAQVDSSVGGKVGIDLPAGKNLAGAFWPPVEVLIPLDALKTLDQRQFKNGMAEVWKYGLIMDAPLFNELRKAALGPNDNRLAAVINRCIELKAQVVSEDEFETTGKRAILNFGHTVGHAIEHVSGYGPILHGEAIAAGMIIEARLGELLGLTPSGTSETIAESFSDLNIPAASLYNQDSAALLAAMRRDKKAERGSLAFSLLTQVGACKLVKDVAESDVNAALKGL